MCSVELRLLQLQLSNQVIIGICLSTWGVNYVAQHYLMGFWFRRNPNFNAEFSIPVDEARLREDIIKTQLADGSWQPTPDPTVPSGNLDATIMNYWALKVMGVDPMG